MNILATVDTPDSTLILVERKKQSPRNLKRAYHYAKAKANGVDVERVNEHPNYYQLNYRTTEPIWRRIIRETCAAVGGCTRIVEIPAEKVEEANDYAIKLIDKYFD